MKKVFISFFVLCLLVSMGNARNRRQGNPLAKSQQEIMGRGLDIDATSQIVIQYISHDSTTSVISVGSTNYYWLKGIDGTIELELRCPNTNTDYIKYGSTVSVDGPRLGQGQYRIFDYYDGDFYLKANSASQTVEIFRKLINKTTYWQGAR